jgi:putative nucleotidyltransferase with HDIG domain
MQIVAYLDNCKVLTYQGTKRRIVADIRYIKNDEVCSAQLVKWDISPSTSPYENGFYYVGGKSSSYDGKEQLVIKSDPEIVSVDTPIARATINELSVRLAKNNPNKNITNEFLFSRLMSIMDRLTFLRDFVNRSFYFLRFEWDKNITKIKYREDKLDDKVFNMCGATNMHHNYIGGLLLHLTEVSQIALNTCLTMDLGERDIEFAVAGGLLHDIGKYYEYEVDGLSFTRSKLGKMHEGHISIGIRFLERVFLSYDSNDPERISKSDLEKLLHIIESHHTAEFGPTDPRCSAAFIVHYADQLSAKVRRIEDYFIENSKEEFFNHYGHKVFFRM